jgi:hypothetical protein
MSDSLPTPAQRWSGLKEWEALRRRFPDARLSDSFVTFLETMHRPTPVVERVRQRCEKWRTGYDLERNDRQEYLSLIARQVKVAARAERPETVARCLERIAAFAVLALETEPKEPEKDKGK